MEKFNELKGKINDILNIAPDDSPTYGDKIDQIKILVSNTSETNGGRRRKSRGRKSRRRKSNRR